MTFYKENAARLDRLMKTAIGQNVNVAIKLIGCLVKKQYHSIYKLKRCIQRFEDVAWMAHDIHVVDDHMHKKYKCEEKHEGHNIS